MLTKNILCHRHSCHNVPRFKIYRLLTTLWTYPTIVMPENFGFKQLINNMRTATNVPSGVNFKLQRNIVIYFLVPRETIIVNFSLTNK